MFGGQGTQANSSFNFSNLQSNQQQQQPTNQLFGGFQSNQTTGSQPTTFGLQSNQAGTQQNAFGLQSNQQQQPSIFSGFQQSGPQTSAFNMQPQTSAFNAQPQQSSFPTNANPFGFQNQNQPSTNLFGGTSAFPQNQGLFQSSNLMQALPLYGGNQQQIQHQQVIMQQQQVNIQNIVEPIAKIIKMYAPLVDGQGNPIPQATDSFSRYNPDCKFTSVSYRNKYTQNQLNPQVIDIPINDMTYDINRSHEDLITQKEFGVNRLKSRFDNQNIKAQKLIEQTKDLNDIIQSVDKYISQLQLRYQGLRSKHAQLQLSLLVILRKIEVIRSHGIPIQPSEIKYRDNLNKLAKALVEPSIKLKEILILESQHEKDEDKFIEAVNEEDMITLFNLLDKQRQGLEVLTNILVKDIRDINIVKSALIEESKSK